jgi:hypothetical protein
MSARYSILELKTCTRNCKGHVKVEINSQLFEISARIKMGYMRTLQFVLNRP